MCDKICRYCAHWDNETRVVDWLSDKKNNRGICYKLKKQLLVYCSRSKIDMPDQIDYIFTHSHFYCNGYKPVLKYIAIDDMNYWDHRLRGLNKQMEEILTSIKPKTRKEIQTLRHLVTKTTNDLRNNLKTFINK